MAEIVIATRQAVSLNGFSARKNKAIPRKAGMRMNRMMIFSNPEFGNVRTVTIDGNPWFVGIDVATALGYQNGSRDIQRHVEKEDKAEVPFYDGNKQEISLQLMNPGFIR